MRRHIFIVLNHGTRKNFLPNVDADRDNYLDYFTSAEGGAWEYDANNSENSEITIIEDDFDFDLFKKYMDEERQKRHPLDYVIFVFCGHGYSDENGTKWIEVIPGAPEELDVSVPQLRFACRDIRTLFIDDACLALYRRHVRQLRMFSNIVESTNIDSKQYRYICKSIYNQAILKMPKDTFTAGYATSMGKKAGDDELGGYYSYNLLKVARDLSREMKDSLDDEEDEYVSFTYIHNTCAQIVAKETDGKQKPIVSYQRTMFQLPFVVVPNRTTLNELLNS